MSIYLRKNEVFFSLFNYLNLILKLQQFKSGYTAPPPLFHYGGVPMNFRFLTFIYLRIRIFPFMHAFDVCLIICELFGVIIFRGNWEISRRDLHNTQFLGMVTANRDYVGAEFDDYPSPSPRSVICCRLVAIIVMSSLSLCSLGLKFLNNKTFHIFVKSFYPINI